MIELENLDNYKVKINYKINDKVVGHILVEETIDVINIVDVLVLEEFRNKKIATKLFRYLLDLYKNKKEKIMLEVRKKNSIAIKLYENFGFKTIYERKKYYKDDDALIMEVRI